MPRGSDGNCGNLDNGVSNLQKRNRLLGFESTLATAGAGLGPRNALASGDPPST